MKPRKRIEGLESYRRALHTNFLDALVSDEDTVFGQAVECVSEGRERKAISSVGQRIR